MIVRLRYDGWFNVPLTAREQLGLSSGDQLELNVRDGHIVLSPITRATGVGMMGEDSTVDTFHPSSAQAAEGMVVKRGRGRPRKIVAI